MRECLTIARLTSPDFFKHCETNLAKATHVMLVCIPIDSLQLSCGTCTDHGTMLRLPCVVILCCVINDVTWCPNHIVGTSHECI